jgi:hypothetical protein
MTVYRSFPGLPPTAAPVAAEPLVVTLGKGYSQILLLRTIDDGEMAVVTELHRIGESTTWTLQKVGHSIRVTMTYSLTSGGLPEVKEWWWAPEEAEQWLCREIEAV